MVLCGVVTGQTLSNAYVSVTADTVAGTLSYRFATGQTLSRTYAYVEDVHKGLVSTKDCPRHWCSLDGKRLTFIHEAGGIRLIQHITLYDTYLLIDLEAQSADGLETRNISPLAGTAQVPGAERRLLDVPFDNDDWVHVLEQKAPAKGMSYELTAVYDNANFSGVVVGSVTHDFWKTGIAYRMGDRDSLTVFGGVSTPDNPALPADEGGKDGTHDHAPHGTMVGSVVRSPTVFVGGGRDIRALLKTYGEVNARINGRLEWKGPAPFYWNSFGVEGVLGYEHVMMPAGVQKVSDFLATLGNFKNPVLSIDSYDQGIYSTEMLAALGRYTRKKHQQIGFYFAPFAQWTWKNGIDQAPFAGTNFTIGQVVLKDANREPIAYKDGDWAAYALDPTHPAMRAYLVGQLEKAKAMGATFIKIDFLSAGAQESPRHADPAIRTGIQAFNYGMRLLRHLSDSILGPDVFYTEAISPLFPSQYTHARFLTTDIYSHLRDDDKGFPNWGSTEYSLASASHLGWAMGTLWPYTNLDVTVMEHFQKNPALSEQTVKVRLYALMVMGSILGDGSDYRSALAQERARMYLDNPSVCAFFSHPRVFTPLKWADGPGFDQQMVFCLKGDTTLVGLFNFSRQGDFAYTLSPEALGLPAGNYVYKDFLTGQTLTGQVSVPKEDALMIDIIKQ
ncbi:hypothetical protein EDB95_4706 [Dinghuibacter silviterrae]|uniref:Alpha-galactosidase n=2 Tax=Dinghuibacter silviterrae TaxID=1539049 RepID=A0A4R8DIQ5_9BACT|nr:hypothetical protein EDB95_4706 [Dinghuibacter silviterrae]